MITVTPAAAEQIRTSAKQGRMEGMPLRIAALRQADGSFHYAMGFDDAQREGDARFTSHGIELVIAPTSAPLLQGTVVDYVELEPDKFDFIFMNPNDPDYQAPADTET